MSGRHRIYALWLPWHRRAGGKRRGRRDQRAVHVAGAHVVVGLQLVAVDVRVESFDLDAPVMLERLPAGGGLDDIPAGFLQRPVQHLA